MDAIRKGVFHDFNQAFFPDIRTRPIACGAAWGVVTGIFMGSCAAYALIRYPAPKNSEILDYSAEQQKVREVTSGGSALTLAFVSIKAILMQLLIAPLFEQLIYRDFLYEKIEMHCPNTAAVHFAVMPLFYVANAYDPRLGGGLGLANPLLAGVQGAFLTLLRQESGGITAPYMTQLVGNLVSGLLTGLALGYKSARARRAVAQEEKLPEGTLTKNLRNRTVAYTI